MPYAITTPEHGTAFHNAASSSPINKELTSCQAVSSLFSIWGIRKNDEQGFDKVENL